MADKPPPLRERYARTICEARGADPEEPITIGYPDGTQKEFEKAWEGYLDLADRLLALRESRTKG